MRTTAQVREFWAPHCQAKWGMLQAWRAVDIIMQKWNYRPRAGVTGSYNCRQITGGSNWSLHAYGPAERYIFWTGVAVTLAVACDVNWDKNSYGRRLVTDMPRGMIDEILAIKTVDGIQVFRWGGYFQPNYDAMHFEINVSPAELARGVVMPDGGGGGDMPLTDEDIRKVADAVWVRVLRDARPDVDLNAPAETTMGHLTHHANFTLSTVERMEKKLDAIPGSPDQTAVMQAIHDDVKAIREVVTTIGRDVRAIRKGLQSA